MESTGKAAGQLTAQTERAAGADVPPRNRWTVLLIAGGAFIATLDMFVVNVAFDRIHAGFPGTSSAAMSWVISAYSIVFAALLVPCGRLADRVGRRSMFRLGMVIFSAASAGSAAAWSVPSLIVFRCVQAVGAALMVPTSLGLLLAAYPPSHHRRIVSWWSAINTTAAACGPPIGGLLAEFDWRWIFLMNLPFAIPAVLAGRSLPDDEHNSEAGLPDFVGSAFLAVGVGGTVAAVSNAAKWGADSSALWICIAVAIGAMAAFFVRCAHHPRPVVDLALLRVKQFAASNVTIFFFQMGFAGVLLAGPLFLQRIWDYSPALAGIAYLPGPVVATVVALICGRIGTSRRTLAVLGFLTTASASFWWATMLDTEPNYLKHFVLGSVLVGAAGGMVVAATIGVGASAVPPAQYATGTSIINTARQIGAAVGVSFVVAALGSAVTPLAFHHAYLITGTVNLIGALVATQLSEPKET